MEAQRQQEADNNQAMETDLETDQNEATFWSYLHRYKQTWD